MIQIVIFVCGMIALVSGKLPRILFGRKYQVTSMGARVVGLILVAPLPMTFLFGVVMAIVGGENGMLYSGLMDWGALIASLIIARQVGKQYRVPAQTT